MRCAAALAAGQLQWAAAWAAALVPCRHLRDQPAGMRPHIRISGCAEHKAELLGAGGRGRQREGLLRRPQHRIHLCERGADRACSQPSYRVYLNPE